MRLCTIQNHKPSSAASANHKEAIHFGANIREVKVLQTFTAAKDSRYEKNRPASRDKRLIKESGQGENRYHFHRYRPVES